jgi:arylsulfatase A-like enzyme
MHIILIISDTFRYDHISPNNKAKVDTPELDQLTADSVFFEKCYAGSFPTVPHRYDLLTGFYGFPFRGWERLRPDDVTLAEILLDYGYITQLITDTSNLLRRGYNFDRGYIGYHLVRGQERDIGLTKMNEPIRNIIPAEKTRHTFYFDGHPQIDISQWVNSHWRREEDRFAAQLGRIAANWIEDNYEEENFFLHLDFFDPHEPWDPPEYLVQKYHPGYNGTPITERLSCIPITVWQACSHRMNCLIWGHDTKAKWRW